MSTYLTELTLRLATGIAELPEPTRAASAEFFLSRQQPDGGFAGRQGRGDLYYTSFALRGLAMLGRLYGPVADRAANYLRDRLAEATATGTMVDLTSLLTGMTVLASAAGVDLLQQAPASRREEVERFLDASRRDDGGYAKRPASPRSTTYNTFLALLCREMIDAPIEDAAATVRFIGAQRTDGGGFREIHAGKRAGTNPTAAAIGSLRLLDALDTLDARARRDTIGLLASMQTEEGGLRANLRIPIADLLSTFTGLSTLMDLDAADRVDLTAIRNYVENLADGAGGYRGANWDAESDVEYTFYGLGCLGLLPSYGQ